MAGCPPLGADPSLTATLGSLDCQVNGAVAGGYGRLFGAGGAFGGALTAALTIFVAVLALGLITGRTRLTLSALTPKAMAFVLVLTFATAWPAYQVVIYGLLTGGPDEVASAFMGAHAGAAQAFAVRLDRLFDAMVDVGQAVSALPKAPNLEVATGLVWTSALALLLSTLGLLVIARIVLAVLLALGPVFLVFALFGGTRGLFEGWLRTAVAFALAPMLIVLGGAGLMSVLEPLIDAIGDDPAGAVADLRPVVTLFLAAMVYAALALTLMAVAVSLTRGWRLPFAWSPANSGSPGAAATETSRLASTTVANRPAPGTAGRTAGIVSAVLRDASQGGGVQPPVSSRATATPDSPRAAPSTHRRAEGLGQTFRAPADRRALTGTLGS